MTEPSVCARCGQRPVAMHGWNHAAQPPRELWLCQECWDFERGSMALRALGEAGVDASEFVDSDTEAAVRTFGRELGGLWYGAPDALIAEMERRETPEQLAAFADYLREIGATLDQPPSAAVKAFLDRHSPPRTEE